MTCKDCIHCRVCITYQFAKSIDKEVSECDEFQNKADFVEVVRCRNCKYYETDIWDGEILCGCNNPSGMQDVSADSYCSDGERRKENE